MSENNSLEKIDQKKNTLYFLIGPTAVGKTATALRWAEANDAEILSCDALLVYCGMDIGTAKPSEKERQLVPHHGINIVPVHTTYSVDKYLKMAQKVVAEVFKRKRKLLITGGSGFYLKSFFSPVVDDCYIPENVQQYVQKLEANEGLAALRQELLALNPSGLEAFIDLDNPRRLAKGLMRCMASGKTIPQLREDFLERRTPFDGFEKKVVCLMRHREDLKERIYERTGQMIEQGLIDEVQFLKKAGIAINPSPASAIGYREVLAFLENGESVETLRDRISQNTIRLLKKQLTWLRKQISIDQYVFLNPHESADYKTFFERNYTTLEQ